MPARPRHGHQSEHQREPADPDRVFSNEDQEPADDPEVKDEAPEDDAPDPTTEEGVTAIADAAPKSWAPGMRIDE